MIITVFEDIFGIYTPKFNLFFKSERVRERERTTTNLHRKFVQAANVMKKKKNNMKISREENDKEHLIHKWPEHNDFECIFSLMDFFQKKHQKH